LIDFLLASGAWFFVLLAGGVGVAVLAVRATRSADFVIRRGNGRPVQVRGRVAAAKRGTIKAFCEQDLGATVSFTVRGSFGPGRALRLRFSGGLSPAQRQRVRNFLVETLR
jgi:hypothetical protein